jgi:DNA-binding transcriptional MocR family regulator
VPRTPCGPDVTALETLLLKHQPRGVFINSFCHNRRAGSLAPKVALQVLLANKHGVLVIEDDVYADLHCGPGVRLAALDDGVLYVGSYSKTSAAVLRVGFVVAGVEAIARLAQVKMISSMGTSLFGESVLACLLANGAYRKLVQRQRQRLNGHRLAALQLLEDADWEVFGKPVGGLFIWARSRMSDYAHVRTQRSALVSCCHRRRPSAPAVRPMTGNASMWPLPVIRKPGLFSVHRSGSTSSVLKTTWA